MKVCNDKWTSVFVFHVFFHVTLTNSESFLFGSRSQLKQLMWLIQRGGRTNGPTPNVSVLHLLGNQKLKRSL